MFDILPPRKINYSSVLGKRFYPTGSCGISVWGALLPLGLRNFKHQMNRHCLKSAVRRQLRWQKLKTDRSGSPVPSLVFALLFDCLVSQFQLTKLAENYSLCQEVRTKLMQRRQEWGSRRKSQQSEPPISWGLLMCKAYHVLSMKNTRGFSLPSKTSKMYYTSQGGAGPCSQDGHRSQYHAGCFRSLIWDICSCVGHHRFFWY